MQLTPQTINIKVTGQKHRIEQMRTADIFAYVNCADLLESTSYDLPVSLHLPSGLKLVKATPAVIHVEIEN
jgi:YbbR domain-containing protein